MSRTFRRKNFEDTLGGSWARKGRKTNGIYTTYDGPYWNVGGGRRMVEYRPMNKQERWHEWRYMHAESSTANVRSPGHWYRVNRQKQNRSIDKQQLVKWFQSGGEHEPMCEANPRSCRWDWS